MLEIAGQSTPLCQPPPAISVPQSQPKSLVNEGIQAGILFLGFRKGSYRYHLAVFNFASVVRCQRQCRIEMSIFGGGKAQLENLPVWRLLPQHFPWEKTFTRKLTLYIRDIWYKEYSWVRIRRSTWLKILSGLEETEFLPYPAAIVHFQVFIRNHNMSILVFIWNHNMSLLVQVLNSNVFFSLVNFPPDKNIFQNSLAFTKEIKRKHLKYEDDLFH